MRPLAATFTKLLDPVQIVESSEALSVITAPGVEAAIWNRKRPDWVTSELAALPFEHLETVRICAELPQVETSVSSAFASWEGLPERTADWLAKDVAALAECLADILTVTRVLLRLEVVRDDACRKFHKDWVRARMICTYVGPGTEYGSFTADADQHGRQFVVPTGAPILLRGKNWPSGEHDSVLHRSPAIKEAKLSRLVIVIDEAPQDARLGLQTETCCIA